MLDLDAIKARLADLPAGFVLGVDGSYFDLRCLVMNAWGEPEEGGDGGPLDPNEPALMAFRDHAVADLHALVAEVERLRALAPREIASPRFCHQADKRGPEFVQIDGSSIWEACLLDHGHAGECMGQTRLGGSNG